MGFCSGTDIFDPVAKAILDSGWMEPENQASLIRTLMKALYDHDWDCEGDSRYYDHPIVQKVMRELNPDIDYDEVYEDEEPTA